MNQRSRREIWAEAAACVKLWRSEGGLLYDSLQMQKPLKDGFKLQCKGNPLPWWLRWQRICLQCRRCKRHGFNPWV